MTMAEDYVRDRNRIFKVEVYENKLRQGHVAAAFEPGSTFKTSFLLLSAKGKKSEKPQKAPVLLPFLIGV